MWPPAIRDGPRLLLADAGVPRCLLSAMPEGAVPDREGIVRVDILIEDGRIARVCAPVSVRDPRADDAAEETCVVNMDGNQTWPCFVDMHTHLDKGHIWPRAENLDGTFAGALLAAGADRSAHWDADDVKARMDFGVRCAWAHGTAAIRTHLDSVAPQHRITWPVFAAMREHWRGRIELQAVSILLIDHLEGAAGEATADCVRDNAGILGAVVPSSADLSRQLDRAFALAAERGLDLDFHADESGDPAAAALRAIAEAKLRHRFTGRVVVGHCCSLAVQPPGAVERTLDLVALAGLSIVSLPLCNLFLQDRRAGRTPRWRGVTLVHELRARGVPVAVASDNCRDPFYGYGDHDMLEVFREAARIAHLDCPVGEWPAAVAAWPAQIIGAASRGLIEADAPADLVLFNARHYSELLSRPQGDRRVLRNGRSIDTTLPDYRELDHLMAGAPG